MVLAVELVVGLIQAQGWARRVVLEKAMKAVVQV